jgi:hypothetical protein
MPKTSRERDEDARQQRLQHMREQVDSGDLTIRQMTPSERERWAEHSAEADRRATPEQRARRETARARKRATQDRAT